MKRLPPHRASCYRRPSRPRCGARVPGSSLLHHLKVFEPAQFTLLPRPPADRVIEARAHSSCQISGPEAGAEMRELRARIGMDLAADGAPAMTERVILRQVPVGDRIDQDVEEPVVELVRGRADRVLR